mmetsp:Transcript_39264/g.63663  ORF Transcript_39264/g.63663 Transcript_39264/m.63663 type:complete len:589 (+) Transcript_39264:136-1902(+)|eukprot:CAMPEP_0184644164 /NCGR_PEP_ID=MMETSP0308-20130426/926_1 /TAXON_ID=38269 /ORGANISM="Gloeochaete witrockiana, Strain SAG 46.84" /LENGTH=588 /DNA_ID=CAMNT_0027072543 /DNA_START=96 /DNA_END=1862 /DNA_ORIENTATION=+
MLVETVKVNSPNVDYKKEYIQSDYEYQTTEVKIKAGHAEVTPVRRKYVFRTSRKVPKLGVMVVGWGGNNGSTVTAACYANRLGLTWRNKRGVQRPNYWGSVTQASTIRLGCDSKGNEVNIAFKNILPMVDPNDIVWGGWDISSMNIGDAMARAEVLEYDLQRQLHPLLKSLKPLPSIFNPSFVAANQQTRADNILPGSWQLQVDAVRQHIRDFKEKHLLDTVVVQWSANTERFCEVIPGVHDTADNLIEAINTGNDEVSPSTLYAVASVLEGCAFINGSPQNTLVPGLIELAMRHGVQLGGSDFKSGQTKFKSVLVDFLVQAGLKPMSIVSYNHLGNNDGYNLSSAAQFRSKEVSKSNVVDDVVASNPLLYSAPAESPDHVVVIKYVPYVGDSKRAMDEYVAEIFMGGSQTIVVHNTCEDSLLAAPLIIDLALITELCSRISYKTEDLSEFESFHPVLSILSYLLKAPDVPPGTPVVNALFKQRSCLENILRACAGLPLEHNMLLEYKCIPKSRQFLAPNHTGAVAADGHMNGELDPVSRKRVVAWLVSHPGAGIPLDVTPDDTTIVANGNGITSTGNGTTNGLTTGP